MEQSHIDELTNKTFNRLKNSYHLGMYEPNEVILYIEKFIKYYKKSTCDGRDLADFISYSKRANSLNNFSMLEALKSAYIFCGGDKKVICKYLLCIAEEEIYCFEKLNTIVAICSHYLQSELSITNEQLNLLYSKTFDEDFLRSSINSFARPFLELYYSDNHLDDSFNVDTLIVEKFRIYVKDSIGISIFPNEIYKILYKSIEVVISEFFKMDSKTIQITLKSHWYMMESEVRRNKHQEEQKMSKKDLILTKEDIEMLSKII
jgi:hypothetical protein